MAAFRAKDYEITQVKRLSVDYLVPAAMLILFLMGVAFIYSTQSYNIEEIPLRRQFWLKQIFYFLFVGLPVYVALGWADYKWVYNCARIIYAASILLLVPLALKESLDIPIPFVEARYNATRWINLGVFSIQPSELAKIGTCVMAAAMFANHKMGTLKEDWKFWLKLGLVFFVPILLIYLYPISTLHGGGGCGYLGLYVVFEVGEHIGSRVRAPQRLRFERVLPAHEGLPAQ